MIPANSKTRGSGKNKDKTGTIIVEVPKPVIVPMQEAMSVKAIRAVNSMYSVYLNL